MKTNRYCSSSMQDISPNAYDSQMLISAKETVLWVCKEVSKCWCLEPGKAQHSILKTNELKKKVKINQLMGHKTDSVCNGI